MTAPAKLRIEGLHKRFGDREVLRDLGIEAHEGEFVSILGPSGSGKSTTFGVLTGAVRPDAGRILVDGAPLRDGTGEFAYMPQRDVLLPWRRIRENATLGLEVRGVRRAEARRRVEPLLSTFGLAEFADAYPSQLSGGMRQRAALLRTVVQECGVLLLDEPFGALDALTRTEMQTWMQEVWERYRWTVVLITHDVREAVFLSDRVYVLSARPGTVVHEAKVPLERPRTLASLTDPRAVALEAELLDALLSTGAHRPTPDAPSAPAAPIAS